MDLTRLKAIIEEHQATFVECREPLGYDSFSQATKRAASLFGALYGLIWAIEDYLEEQERALFASKNDPPLGTPSSMPTTGVQRESEEQSTSPTADRHQPIASDFSRKGTDSDHD
jgi:hypothetical protein